MNQIRYPREALAACFAIASLLAGCSASHQPVPGAVSSTPFPTITSAGRQAPPTAASEDGHGRRGGSSNGSATAGGLPADWPPDLPTPPGSINGSTGSAGRWTVLILAPGSAAKVRQSAAALYTAADFTAVSDSLLHKGRRQITLVVENRDHSVSQTNLVIEVTTQ